MSTEIDNRVVSMQFDNSQFERNVQTSIGTLDKLKQSLNMKGAVQGLSEVDSASKKVNFEMMGRGVDAVQAKFSALQVMAVTALANITNSAVNAGKKIASSFTIDPIKSGFQEYETQIGAVQTILANTESKGSTLDDVNNALDELNTYADKTIYNFTEMTRNIGTFTAAGVALDKSVTSIKGIANLAAVSGSTSQQASTAMYQLSQALAAGKVQLMDWNSVVNAGMGGQVFQEALKRTAKHMGKNVDAMIKKYGSFRESLSKGNWLTAEVLTETLTQLSGAYSEADLIAQGYSKKQAKEIVQLADTAVNAATKVKTFTQLVDTLKEAAQSGWTQTWELIVGDFEEAKVLWTEISDELGGIINKTSESRNALMKDALTSNWDKLKEKIDEAGIETKTFEDQIKKTAKKHKVDIDELVKKHGTLKVAIQEGAISTDILKESVNELGKKLPNLEAINKKLQIGNKGKDVKELQKALKTLKFDIGKTGVDGDFGKKTETAVKAFQKANKLKVTGIVDAKTLAALDKATTGANELNNSVKGLIDNVTKLGGRDLLIDSLRNAFEALKSVVNPIKEAFEEVFPAPTAKQIYNAIEAFHKFTEKLILNEKQQEKLKTTFQGLFSIVKIVVDVVKQVIGGIVSLFGNLTGMGDGILDITSGFGKWAIELQKTIAQTDIFGRAIRKVVNAIQNALSAIHDFVYATKEKIRTDGLDTLLTVFGGIAKVAYNAGKKIAEIFGSIGDAIIKAFKGGDIKSGLEIINGVIFLDILKNVKKFVKGISGLFESSGEAIESLGGALGSLKGILEQYQKNLKAQMLMKIATAIAILAAAVLIISLINPDKLMGAVGAISVLFWELNGSMKAITNLEGMKGAAGTVTMMIGMSVAILILAGAVSKLAKLDPEKLVQGVVGVIALVAVMTKASKELSTIEGKVVKGAGGIILFAVAIKILASAVGDLGELSLPELAKGLVGVGILIAGLTYALTKMPDGKGMVSIGIGMVLMGAAMKIFASAIADLGGMSLESLGKGVIGMAIALYAVVGALNLLPDSGKLISSGISMVLIGAAMKILASAMADIGSLSWEQIGKGLAGMGVALYGIVGAMHLMPKDMVGKSVGLIIVAAALAIIGKTLNSLGGMSWEQIGKGLAGIGGSLAILAIGLHFMTSSLAGAAALVVASIAIGMLVPSLIALGNMGWEEIAKALVMIAGAITVFAVAAAILTTTGLIVPMLALAGAVALFGLGCLAAGVGIAALATGITALATGGMASITAIVVGLIALIPAAMVAIGKGIVDIVNVLTKNISAFEKFFLAIGDLLVSTFVKIVPKLVDAIVILLAKLLATIDMYLPEILQSAINIVLTILKGIRDNIGEVVIVAIEVILAFLDGLAEGAVMLVDGAFDMIIKFIEGLADAIDKNTDRLISAVHKLMFALIRASVKVLTGGIVDIKKIGEKIMKSGFIKGVKEKFSDAKKTVKELPGKLKDAILDKLSDLKNAGKDLMDGFINGIKDKMSEAGKAAAKVGKKALGSIKDVLGIKSPSREFMKIGRFADLGLVKGLEKFSGNVTTAASDVGSVALDGIKGAMSRISDVINSDMDSQPTIRPVLDLSDVEAGAGAINGMFGMTPSVGVMSNLGAISSMMSTNQNGGNDDVVSAIKDLNKSLGNMSGNTYNVNGVTYDDGSNIANAVQSIARAAIRERRI